MLQLELPPAPDNVTSITTSDTPVPRWLFYWSLITVIATFPLLTLGAEVTTNGYGMADPQGLRTPWHLFKVWAEGALGEFGGIAFVIEHAHRVAGWIVGLCVTVLMIGLISSAKVLWLKFLGVACFLAVAAQGLLGIFRVDLNALMGNGLAMVHGCTAQLVFALLVGTAVVTSRSWHRIGAKPFQQSANLFRIAVGITFLVYGQLLLGALVRHNFWHLAARAHLLNAFLVFVAILWLLYTVQLKQFGRPAINRIMCFLLFALGIQIWLGLEAWLSKFAPRSITELHMVQVMPFGDLHGILRSLHYVTGSLVFAGMIALTLFLYKTSRVGTTSADGMLAQRSLRDIP